MLPLGQQWSGLASMHWLTEVESSSEYVGEGHWQTAVKGVDRVPRMSPEPWCSRLPALAAGPATVCWATIQYILNPRPHYVWLLSNPSNGIIVCGAYESSQSRIKRKFKNRFVSRSITPTQYLFRTP